jgi:hypothetical protein
MRRKFQWYRNLRDSVELGCDNDCPRIGNVDLLLEALRREHGDERPDIEPATIPRPWRKFEGTDQLR